MTVYNLLLENLPKSALTNTHLNEIGMRISRCAKDKNVSFRKIKQLESDSEYTVNDYPDTFTADMIRIATRYFQGLK